MHIASMSLLGWHPVTLLDWLWTWAFLFTCTTAVTWCGFRLVRAVAVDAKRASRAAQLRKVID